MRGRASETRLKSPGQIAREAVRSIDRRLMPGPEWNEYPGNYSTAIVEYDFRLAELFERVAREAVAAAGYNPDEPVVAAATEAGIVRGSDEREAADEVETDRIYNYSVKRLDLPLPRRDLGSHSPKDREAWRKVYGRSLHHGARHRRAPGAKPVRRRGSSRNNAPTRAGPDEGDPEPVGTRPRTCWQPLGAAL